MAHKKSRTTLGQKLLENILLMTLKLGALSPGPFKGSAEFSGGGCVLGEGRGAGVSLESFKKSRASLEAQSVKTACNVGDPASIPGPERSQGGGHGDPLKYSRPENPHGSHSDSS